MIEGSETGLLESVIALNMALGENLGKDLTEYGSERNISSNVVRVCAIDEILSQHPNHFSFKGESGSGLMITTNGFIVTAYHNIRSLEDEWRRINEEDPITQGDVGEWISRMVDRFCIIDQEGNRYAIDTSFYAILPDKDLALIKAATCKRPEAIKFKVVTEPLQVGDEVKCFGLKNGSLYNQYGKVISENFDAQINDPETGEVRSTIYNTFFNRY